MEPKEVIIEDVSAVVKRLSVTLPQAEVEKELAKTYRQLARNVKIKGFRPGKAPRFVLERQYGPRINQDVASRLINESWPAAIKDRDLEPVVQPTIEEQHFEPGQDFSYTARIEVKPPIDLEDLSGLDVEPPEVKVSEAMVDEQIERLRDSQASLAPLDEDRPVRAGDWVTINYRILVDGQALEGGQV
ncbi:MAG: trigger factor, partial [Proteobacteria bacterium]|nr:trigger factor [Pseudomonadota bacterium]